MIALGAADRLVQFDFWFSFTASFNLPTLALTAVTGLLTGWAVGVFAARFALQIHPWTAALWTINILFSYQLATGLGSALYRPVDAGAYLGGHLSYLVLAVCYGVALAPGMRLAARGAHEDVAP